MSKNKTELSGTDLVQDVYVADVNEFHDDGEEVMDVILESDGWTPDREELYDAVYRAGLDPARMHEHPRRHFAKVTYNSDGSIKEVDIHQWALDEYGF